MLRVAPTFREAQGYVHLHRTSYVWPIRSSASIRATFLPAYNNTHRFVGLTKPLCPPVFQKYDITSVVQRIINFARDLDLVRLLRRCSDLVRPYTRPSRNFTNSFQTKRLRRLKHLRSRKERSI